MIETSRQNINMGTTGIKRPNNYISHDRLNFKRSGPRMSSDEARSMTSPASGRRLRAIQPRCYIVLCGVCVQALYTTAGEIQYIVWHNKCWLWWEARVHVIYTYAQIFIFPAWLTIGLNPLSPHDALKHHFTSLKTDLIFLQPSVLERKFPWDWLANTWQFSLIFKPHEIIFIHYKSRIEVAIRRL